MERIGVRELRQYASRYLERVKAGESIEVTERGKLVALLVSPSPAQSARARLVEAGSLVPSTQPFSLPQRSTLTGSPSRASEALQDLRTDRI
jgi:prevent-host-death family protein